MEQKSIKAGDRVRIKSLEKIKATLNTKGYSGDVFFNECAMARYAGQEATAESEGENRRIMIKGYCWVQDWLEPATESEAAPLDLCKLLEGCEGMTLYSVVEGPVTLEFINPNYEGYPIRCTDCVGDGANYTREGYFLSSTRDTGGECVLFPAKDQRDWSKWEKPGSWKPRHGQLYRYVNSVLDVLDGYNDNAGVDIKRIAAGNCFRTREEAEAAAEELKRCLTEFRSRKNH